MTFTRDVTLMLGLDENNICNHLTREYQQGFQALGLRAETFQLTKEDNTDALLAHLADMDCGLIIAMAGMGMDTVYHAQQKKPLDIPIHCMLLDPAIIYWIQVIYPATPKFITTLAGSDVPFVAQNSKEHEDVFQLSHAALPKERTAWSQKDIGLFYCASLRHDPEETRTSWNRFPAPVKRLLNDMTDLHLATDGKNLMANVVQVLNHYKVDYSQENFMDLFKQVDLYFRDRRRVDTLKQIIHDAPMVLAGPGWDTVIDLDAYRHVKYLGRIHPDEVRMYNERAKMVLNVINYYHASHERVFSAMADGAVCLSSHSPFYEDSFDENDAVFFHWKERDLGDRIHELLHDRGRLETIADAGNAAFLKAHTWKHRAERVLAQIFKDQA